VSVTTNVQDNSTRFYIHFSLVQSDDISTAFLRNTSTLCFTSLLPATSNLSTDMHVQLHSILIFFHFPFFLFIFPVFFHSISFVICNSTDRFAWNVFLKTVYRRSFSLKSLN